MDYPYFYNNKKRDFPYVTLRLNQKILGVFREFSEKFPGKFFTNFRSLWNFPEISPGIFPDSHILQT